MKILSRASQTPEVVRFLKCLIMNLMPRMERIIDDLHYLRIIRKFLGAMVLFEYAFAWVILALRDRNMDYASALSWRSMDLPGRTL